MALAVTRVILRCENAQETQELGKLVTSFLGSLH